MADVNLPLSMAKLSLDSRHLDAVSEADPKVGSKVRIVIWGTVTRAEKSAEQRMDETATSGEIDIDIRDVRMVSNNDIADLFDDDLDG